MEFNLSEKICPMACDMGMNPAYSEKDVKEFIRLSREEDMSTRKKIKEMLLSNSPDTFSVGGRISLVTNELLLSMRRKDKLAGDILTGEKEVKDEEI